MSSCALFTGLPVLEPGSLDLRTGTLIIVLPYDQYQVHDRITFPLSFLNLSNSTFGVFLSLRIDDRPLLTMLGITMISIIKIDNFMQILTIIRCCLLAN